VVAAVTGTDQDPQVRARQVQVLHDAGAVVAPSNALAVCTALGYCGMHPAIRSASNP
jgi:hypothetical protein